MNELMRHLLFLPEQGTQLAENIDKLHYFVITATMIASTALGVFAIWCMAHFRRRRRNQTTPHVEASLPMEIIFVGLPLVLFLFWFAVGFRQFTQITEPPSDAMDVYVMGKKWMWKFAYPGGPNGLNVLRVPKGRNVRLLMTSRDVIHSFYIPGFRIKTDVLPGRYTQMWFHATTPGRYPVFCAEYCGTGHSMMRAEVDVLEPEEYDTWLASEQRGRMQQKDTPPLVDTTASAPSDMIAEGRRLAGEHGCLKCHSVDGTQHIGPTWLDMYGRTEKLNDGTPVLIDEGYITESMMSPKAKLVAGYQTVMPSYLGKLTGPESAAIVEYIKSLRTSVEERPAEGPVYKVGPDAEKAAEETK
jgi:cytochrome c oxidase subunit 2